MSTSTAATRLARPAPCVSIAASAPGIPVSTTIASGQRRSSSRCQACLAASRTTRTSGRSSGTETEPALSVTRIPSAPGQSAARPWSNSPAATFAPGTSSTTNGGSVERGCTADPKGAPSGLGADLGPGCTHDCGRGRPGGGGGDAARRLLEALAREPALADRGDDRRENRFDGVVVHVVADAERVGARSQRAHGALLDADAGTDRAHLERVRDHEPVEAELLAKEPGQDPRAERRRSLVERGHDEMCGHHRLHARSDRGAEREQRRLEVARDDGQADVRVDGGVTVAGEVLRARGDALALRSLDERRHVPGHELRIGAEAAHADHRVVGVRVHVGDGREVHVHAAGGEPAGDRGGDVGRQGGVVDDAEREVAGERAAGGRLQPRHVAALLVDREQDVPGLPQPRGQRRELLRVADVVGEERDPAEPTLEQPEHPVRHVVAGEAREQAGRRQALDAAHDLTAPAVSPNAIRRCTSTKKMTTGTAVSVAPAISEPQSVPRCVVKFASQIVSVCLSWEERRT